MEVFKVQLSYLSVLPLHLKRMVYKSYGLRNDVVDHKSNLKIIRNRKQLQKVVHSSVSKLVRGSSTSQSLKGIMTGGLKKSIAYGAEKLMKMMRGLKKWNIYFFIDWCYFVKRSKHGTIAWSKQINYVRFYAQGINSNFYNFIFCPLDIDWDWN